MKRLRRFNSIRYRKKRKIGGRNFDDPTYINWRKQIYKRDYYVCQFPGCLCRKNIHAHHILMWAHYPAMRFEISNGITLCRKCHDKIHKNEKRYAKLLVDIVARRTCDD